MASLSHTVWQAGFLGPVSQIPCGLKLAPQRPPGRVGARARAQEQPCAELQQRPFPWHHPSQPPSCLRAWARWGFPSAFMGRPVFSSSFPGGAHRALAWGLSCLSVPCPSFVPFGALMMPSEAYGCCPTAAPPGPGQGSVWLPTWPCFVWSALILTPSHLDLTVGCLLSPPHAAHSPVPSWGSNTHSLYGN